MDARDLAILATHFGGNRQADLVADMNGDGVVNGVDLAFFSHFFGRTDMTCAEVRALLHQ